MAGALNEAVAGCLDTLQVARMKLPKNKSYKQESLVETLLGKTYEAHNAIADVKILQELYEKCLKLSQDELSSHVFAFLSVQHKGTLDKLVSTSVISKQTQSKLARSGLGLHVLKMLHQRDQENGIRSVLSELVNGKPRITKDKTIIGKLRKYLDSLSDVPEQQE